MGMLRSALEELIADEPDDRTHVELRDEIVEIARAIDVLNHQLAVRVDSVARRGGFGADGFLSPTSWLAVTADLAHSTARRTLALGKVLGEHSATARQALSGELSGARVRLLVQAASAHPDHYQKHEEMLLGFAHEMSLRDMRKAVDYWSNCADASRAEEDAHAQRQRSYVHASTTLDGMVKIDGLVDKETGEAILAAFNAAMTPQARAEGVDARPAPQRRAEALGEICRQFLDNYPGVVGGQRPHVSLIVDLDTLLADRTGKRCELSHTGTITPEAARRILCDAQVARVVVDGDSVPIDLGREVRTATPAQLRALAVRDGGCVWPGCDRPPSWCDAHHIIHWLDLGPTDLSNLELLCRRHHSERHAQRYRPGTSQDHTIHRD